VKEVLRQNSIIYIVAQGMVRKKIGQIQRQQRDEGNGRNKGQKNSREPAESQTPEKQQKTLSECRYKKKTTNDREMQNYQASAETKAATKIIDEPKTDRELGCKYEQQPTPCTCCSPNEYARPHSGASLNISINGAVHLARRNILVDHIVPSS
jgi:hypothetical protein